MNYKIITRLLNKIKKKNPKILVIGDLMLDQYVTGEVNRISPEAPVPILNFQKEEAILGGAGNVVHNLLNLGADVRVASIIGDDLNGGSIINLLNRLEISSDLVFISKRVNTTKKTRFLTNGTQLLRVDHDSKGLIEEDLILLKEKVIQNIENIDSIVVSDYNKGVCSESFIQVLIAECNKMNKPIYIDPKGTDWRKYIGATCITPNTNEVENQLNLKLKTNSEFEKAAKSIKKKLQLQSCLITKGADGMTYYDDIRVIHQKVEKKEVFDVSGAGDTVIACLAASISSKLRLSEVLLLSSFISSEVVSHVGTTPFNIHMIDN